MSPRTVSVFLLSALLLTASFHPAPATAQEAAPAAAEAAVAADEAEGEMPAVNAAGLTPSQENRKLKAELLELRESFKRCALVEERGIRITCYDVFSKDLGIVSAEHVAKEEQKLGEIGFWQLSTQTASDGLQDSYVRIESSNTIRAKGGAERHAVLAIRCSPGKTDVFLDWKSPVLSGSRLVKMKTMPITYFANNEPPKTEQWQVSNDKQALFSLDPVNFVRNMLNKKKMSIEFAPDNGSTEGVYFEITGVEAAVNSVILKNCYQ